MISWSRTETSSVGGRSVDGSDETKLECQEQAFSPFLPKTSTPTPTPQLGMEEDSSLTQVSEEVLCYLEKSLEWRE